jgi:hypothetical protein
MPEALDLVQVQSQRCNAAVQPAEGEEVSTGETFDPPLGCNGLLRLGGLRAGRVTVVVPESLCLSRAAIAMEWISPPATIASLSRVDRISSTIGSNISNLQ